MHKISFILAISVFLLAACSGGSKKEQKSTEIPEPKIEDKKVTSGSQSSELAQFAFDETSFKFSFTGFGAKDKSYRVTGITFNEFSVNSPANKLKGTTLNVKLASIDTKADMNNGLGSNWPDAMAPVRNNNIIMAFINNLNEKETAKAKVIEIHDSILDLEVTLNGVTKIVEMKYLVENGMLTAQGTTDVADYNAGEAFKKLAALCSVAFHHGKSWSDIELTFSVNVD